jgi:hypothetical protein
MHSLPTLSVEFLGAAVSLPGVGLLVEKVRDMRVISVVVGYPAEHRCSINDRFKYSAQCSVTTVGGSCSWSSIRMIVIASMRSPSRHSPDSLQTKKSG